MIDEQLTLGLGLRDDATFASFYPAGNMQVFNAILHFVRGYGEQYIYLWGPVGSGRSHLLQACCHAAPECHASAVYLPLADAHLDLFAGLENVSLICVDDVENIAGKDEFEEQLFHLFNRVRANNKRLIITGNVPPSNLEIKMPDLRSRLAWGVVYQLQALEDEQKLKALQQRAQSRGLELEPSVGKFLLRRCPRNMQQLFNTLEDLDHASLVQKRRLTIPFVKEVLGV